jgi:hypothetical protein
LTETDTHGGVGNDLADWFPIVEATGVPVPRTLIIDAGPTIFEDMVDDLTPRQATVDAMNRVGAAVNAVGTPAFLRTGEMSGKHQWGTTCFVADVQRTAAHLYTLIHTQAAAFGVDEPRHFVVRELLATEPAFIAFDGMPVTRERRYFVRDGKVYDHHEYWPAKAIIRARDADGTELSEAEWKPMLRELSTEPRHEVAELTKLSERAAVGLVGAWSLDWLWTADRGWVFIDAAHAERSYTIPVVDRAASANDVPQGFAFDDESVDDAVAALKTAPAGATPENIVAAVLAATLPQVVAELDDISSLMQSAMTTAREALTDIAYADNLFAEVLAWLELEQLRRPSDESLDDLAALVNPWS